MKSVKNNKFKLLILGLICVYWINEVNSIIQAQENSNLKIKDSQTQVPNLIFPGLLKKEELESGNPLSTYAAMLDLEKDYLSSKVFADIFPEIRFNFEEFLGFPFSGLKAMEFIEKQNAKSKQSGVISKSFKPYDALKIIEREAKNTQLVIWAEEHHLPQTRSLYEQLLKRLWKEGYRYLAAEAFSDDVMRPDFKFPTYKSGYYLKDPVFASAIRLAHKLGYKLISYDTNDQGPPDDPSFRNRTQANNIKSRIFDQNPSAKVLIFAGRGHASEVIEPSGFTPMANVLKKITGIDPFTIYAPTMTARLNHENEHPLYRYAVANKLIKRPTIFAGTNLNEFLGSGACDAYIFFPEIKLINGRPDWMIREMRRKPVLIPNLFLHLTGMRLIQAFETNEPDSVIPVDQIILNDREKKVLMLPKGSFRLRAINKESKILKEAKIIVR